MKSNLFRFGINNFLLNYKQNFPDINNLPRVILYINFLIKFKKRLFDDLFLIKIKNIKTIEKY